MLTDEVFVVEFFAIDGFAARTLDSNQADVSDLAHRAHSRVSHNSIPETGGETVEESQRIVRTLPLVKSPPWSMNPGMIRWNLLPS